ncbi:delta(12) fatty acid desaturase-like protein [Tanacetum coccineum]|uniref:Delta(12) fatty acid desaturase-like protein n=1 Tax=Tanacetum coccineum TaxID=301880 RepID=A0ABQ5HDK2_9ASTR
MSDSSEHEGKDILKRVPVDPPFSLSDLKKAIPAHCFERSVIRSSYYVVHDLIVTYVFYFLENTYIPLLPTPLAYVAWPVYWFCQASILTGLWVIGHECGHHAFSEYQWIDDTVGFILHSALFTPYFSWKYSHRNHHANTNSIDNDEVYIPKRKSKVTYYSKILNNPPGRVVLSDIGILALIYAVKLLVAAKGAAWVACMYGVPVLGVHMFFVLITYLHHTHLSLPHYDSTEWNWIRGALSTIDRDFGFLNRVFHDVTHTHVLHHLISYIPHYHAKEARDAIKPVLGEFYKIDRTPIFKAMWREAKECIYIEPDEDSKEKKKVVDVEEDVNKKENKVKGKEKAKTQMVDFEEGIRQLFEAMRGLSPERKKVIREMGFGDLIEFLIFEIPTKLAFYVIDILNTTKNDVRVSNGRHSHNSKNSKTGSWTANGEKETGKRRPERVQRSILATVKRPV